MELTRQWLKKNDVLIVSYLSQLSSKVNIPYQVVTAQWLAWQFATSEVPGKLMRLDRIYTYTPLNPC